MKTPPFVRAACLALMFALLHSVPAAAQLQT